MPKSKGVQLLNLVGGHDEMVQELMERPGFKDEHSALDEEFAIYREIIRARKEAGLSAAEIAERMGTKKPAISRLTNSILNQKHSPSLATLMRFAHALGCNLEIRFTPKHS